MGATVVTWDINKAGNEETVKQIKAELKKGGWNAVIGGCIPEYSRCTGGVAVIARDPHLAVELEPRTHAFKEAKATGRLGGYWLNADGSDILFISLYGWTAAGENQQNAERTDDIMCIIFDEVDVRNSSAVDWWLKKVREGTCQIGAWCMGVQQ